MLTGLQIGAEGLGFGKASDMILARITFQFRDHTYWMQP